ncbi:MAG: hypothetical protein KGL39_38160 [Patescibacteria group bacterium]|nr:hypothetical protein [Patescibacteria group bacterium]
MNGVAIWRSICAISVTLGIAAAWSANGINAAGALAISSGVVLLGGVMILPTFWE